MYVCMICDIYIVYVDLMYAVFDIYIYTYIYIYIYIICH